MQAPCKNCPLRAVGCHSTCEKYIAYDNYRKEIRKIVFDKKRLDHDIYASSRHRKKNK